LFDRREDQRASTALAEFSLWGQTWPNTEVAGESHHAAAIAALFPSPVPEDGTEASFTAHLVPEPSNRYDRHAVQVVIGGNLVGYLPRESASAYQPSLIALGGSGRVATVEARVWALPEIDHGYDRRGNPVARRTGHLHARVTLALAAPHMILPLNLAPAGVELPLGRALKLSSDEAVTAACEPWLQPQGEGWVHVTLHRITETLPRSTRELIEVRLDNAPAGRLSPAMSQNFLPLLDQLEDRGLGCAARAIVKGNKVKAVVTLHAAKASEIAASWLDENVYSHPTRAAHDPAPPSPEARPAGWYDDPEEVAPLRYWDGLTWTSRIKMR
jgi:hypothetical protein